MFLRRVWFAWIAVCLLAVSGTASAGGVSFNGNISDKHRIGGKTAGVMVEMSGHILPVTPVSVDEGTFETVPGASKKRIRPVLGTRGLRIWRLTNGKLTVQVDSGSGATGEGDAKAVEARSGPYTGFLIQADNGQYYLAQNLVVQGVELRADSLSFHKAAGKLQKKHGVELQWKHGKAYKPVAASQKRKLTEAKARAKVKPLARHGRDLTSLAEQKGKLKPIIGRTNEVGAIATVLGKSTRNNVLLTGQRGAGKTGVVEGLAQAVEAGEYPGLEGRPIVELKLHTLGDYGTKKFRKKLSAFVDAAADQDAIIVVDQVERIAGSRHFDRTDVQFIGISSKKLEVHNNFQEVTVRPLEKSDSRQVLKARGQALTKKTGIRVSPDAARAADTLVRQYLPDASAMSEGADILEEAVSAAANKRTQLQRALSKARSDVATAEQRLAKLQGTGVHKNTLSSARKRLERAQERQADAEQQVTANETVGWEQVAGVVKKRTGMPVLASRRDVRRVVFLKENLQNHIDGQDQALDAIHSAVQNAYAGLSIPGRPIGSFVFHGTSGVGKTQTAKALAHELFGDSDALVSVNLAHASPEAVRDALTSAVRKRPFSVVLLDEIDKNPDVLPMLLQLTGEGTMRDSENRVVRFDNTVVIGTTNAKKVGGQFVGNYKSLSSAVQALAVTQGAAEQALFPEEFRTRVTEVGYKKLTYKVKRNLVLREIKRIKKALAADKLSLDLEITPQAVSRLAKKLKVTQGARFLQQQIQDEIATPIAQWKNAGGFAKGDKLRLSVGRGEIELKVKRRGHKTYTKGVYKDRAMKNMEGMLLEGPSQQVAEMNKLVKGVQARHGKDSRRLKGARRVLRQRQANLRQARDKLKSARARLGKQSRALRAKKR